MSRLLLIFAQILGRRWPLWALLFAISMTGSAYSDTGAPGGEPRIHEDVCNYVVEHAGREHFLRDRLLRFGIFDTNNDGQPEIVEMGATGTAGGDYFRLKTLAGSTISYSYPAGDDFEEFVRSSYGGAWLPFRGKLYLLRFADEAALFVRVAMYMGADNSLRIVCLFDNKIKQLMYMTLPRGRGIEASFCNRFLQDVRPTAIEFESPAQITVGRLNRSSPGGRHHPTAQAAFDFDNDGSPENIVLIDLASGAGRGCDLTYYDLTDSAGSNILEGPKRDLLLKMQGVNIDEAYPHRRCDGDVSQWVEHDGTIFFEMRYRGDTPKRAQDLYHQVWAARNSSVEKVCDSSFTVRPVLRDSAKKP